MPETDSFRRSTNVSILTILAMAVCLLALFGGIGNAQQAYADETENIAFSVPAKVPFAVKADGTIIGPSASAWRIENKGTRPLRMKDVAASGFDDGSAVSAVSEAMPVAGTSTRGIWSINVSGGGASLTASVDGTIEIPVGGSAGFTWNANSPDGTKHTVAPVPMLLGTVSFRFGGAEPIAFAVYSDDDKSLDFYKRLDVPEVGDTFEGKTVTGVYTGIETDTYASRAEVPWANHKADIVKIKVVDRIRPVSMVHWFDMADIDNPKITEADLSEVDTGACKSMAALFQYAKSLNRIDGLRNWDTSKVSNLSYMFFRCWALTSLDVSNWNTSSCTTMRSIFGECMSLESLDVSRWDTSKVTNFRFMFAGVRDQYMKLRTVGDLSDWDTSNVTDMSAMFQDCRLLESIGDISGWDTSNVTTMKSMFYVCPSLESVDVSRWDTSKVTNFAFMFAGYGNQYMKLRTVGDLSNWNTSNATDMSAMFQDCEYLENIGDISDWDTSKVANMSWLFNRCVRLNGIGSLSGWDVSHCTEFSWMFNRCTAQEEIDLSGWDISSVKDMSSLFDGMTGLKKISLPASWKWIGSTGTAGYLPAPSSSNIPGADGKWYSTTTGIGYAPADIPSGKADTYVASKELLPKVAFAVYSADDGSLDFYKRPLGETPVVGSIFDGKTVTEVYTGFESTHFSIQTSDDSMARDWTCTELPWWNRRDSVRIATVVDTGITPTSICGWFMRMPNLRTADLSNLDCVNTYTAWCAFLRCTSLTSLKSPKNFNPIDLSDFVYNCDNLKDLDTSTWNMGRCQNIGWAFSGCHSLETLPGAESWNTSSLNYTNGAFAYCDLLKLDCSDWKVQVNADHKEFNHESPGVILPKPWQPTAFAVFSSDDGSLDFYKREFRKLPKTGDTFEGKTVTEVYTGIETTRYNPIDENDANGATNVPWYSRSNDCKSVSFVDGGIKPIGIDFWFHRFKNCISFDVSKLDTSSTSSIEHIFYDCENVRNLDLSTWDLSHCVTAVSAFAYCYNLESIEFGPISTANFKSYGGYWMFTGCRKLSLDCSEWIVDKSAIKYAFNGEAPGVIPPKIWSKCRNQKKQEPLGYPRALSLNENVFKQCHLSVIETLSGTRRGAPSHS